MPSTLSENKQLSAKIPADLSDWLDEEAKTFVLSKTNIVIEALRDYREKRTALKNAEDKFEAATWEALAEAEDPANLVNGEDVSKRLKEKLKTLQSRKN